MRRIALAVIATLPLLAVPAAARELAGVKMADTAEVGGKKLTLNGMAVRKKFIISVYVGGLYLPAKTKDGKKTLAADETRRAVMSFLYGVSKEQLCGAWNEGLTANTPGASDEVKQGFKSLCDAMPATASPGTELGFDYVPGTGTSISVNGQSKATVAGKPFADALFACWIGDKPVAGEAFKTALLEGK